jgi:hypothetical protein
MVPSGRKGGARGLARSSGLLADGAKHFRCPLVSRHRRQPRPSAPAKGAAESHHHLAVSEPHVLTSPVVLVDLQVSNSLTRASS